MRVSVRSWNEWLIIQYVHCDTAVVCVSPAATAASPTATTTTTTAAAAPESVSTETASVSQVKRESLSSAGRRQSSSSHRTSQTARQSKGLSTAQIPLPVIPSPTSPEAAAVPQTPPPPSSTQIVSHCLLLSLKWTYIVSPLVHVQKCQAGQGSCRVHGCVAQLAERRSLAGELILSCTRPAPDGWPLCG